MMRELSGATAQWNEFVESDYRACICKRPSFALHDTTS